MSRKKQRGHIKRHDYPGNEPQKRQNRGNNRGSGQHSHREPRYMTLAEGQQTPEFRELLKEKFARLTVMVYGPRLSETQDFEDLGDSTYRPPQDDRDPLETFSRIYAGDLFADLFTHGFVCIGAKFRSRDQEEYGDTQGKNYLYFQRRADVRPDKKTGKPHYLRPHWADYVILQADLERLQVFKAQLFVAPLSRGGVKHTLKLFTGNVRNTGARQEKPVWNAVARAWVLETIVPAQTQSQLRQPEHQQAITG